MLDIKEKRHITVVGRGGASNVDWDDITNKPEFATVATSGDYDDLSDKPNLATVATSGSYNDLSNTPSLATVATSGSYNDLSNKPTIPTVNNATLTIKQGGTTKGTFTANAGTDVEINLDAGGSGSTDWDDIQNKPTFATVATSGSYSDLSNTPSLATVATSGSYNDLSNTPTIPTVPAMATETLTFTLQGGTTKTIEFYTVPNYFYVEDISGSNNTLSITKSSSYAPTIEVFKSTDKMNWESMGTTSTTAITATIPANGKLYLKANANALWCGNSEHNTMSASGNHNVGGNILSLIYGDNFEGKTTLPTTSYYTHSGFTQLFMNNTKLINANNLILPLTTTIKGVYNCMFWGCTNLLTAPSELPAATLTDSCYASMFNNCTSLRQAPVILSTTAVAWCASSMFNGCTSLNSVICYFTSVSPSGCITNWLNNVAAQGDFWNLGNASYPEGASGIPSGWTTHTSL